MIKNNTKILISAIFSILLYNFALPLLFLGGTVRETGEVLNTYAKAIIFLHSLPMSALINGLCSGAIIYALGKILIEFIWAVGRDE